MSISALDYPRCTITAAGETDCGSVYWSFVLFIAWNLLSMVSWLISSFTCHTYINPTYL